MVGLERRAIHSSPSWAGSIGQALLTALLTALRGAGTFRQSGSTARWRRTSGPGSATLNLSPQISEPANPSRSWCFMASTGQAAAEWRAEQCRLTAGVLRLIRTYRTEGTATAPRQPALCRPHRKQAKWHSIE